MYSSCIQLQWFCNKFFSFFPLSLLSCTSVPLLPSHSPGDGKTHYIKKQLAHSSASLTIAVNEAFTPLNAITKLRTLPLKQKNCAIFFNFTMLPPGVSEGKGKRERHKSTNLIVSGVSLPLSPPPFFFPSLSPSLPHRSQWIRVSKFTTSS